MIPVGHSGAELYKAFLCFLEHNSSDISDERFQEVFDGVIEWIMDNQDDENKSLFEADWSSEPVKFSLSQEGIKLAEKLVVDKHSLLVLVIQIGTETRQDWLDELSSN